MVQSLRDKQYQFYGSNRMSFNSFTLTSGTAYTAVTFSGTSTGFGLEGNELSQRIMLYNSGTTSEIQVNGVAAGTILAGETLTFDGLNASGLNIRSTGSAIGRIWAW